MQQDQRVAIISGGTTGIGREMSIGLAKAGYRVVMLGRLEVHAEDALSAIESSVPSAQASYLLGDLSNLKDVERVGRSLRQEHPVIHVLMNNVGAFYLRRKENPQGIAKTFALNHLSHFYLTHFLLDRLRGAADARIVETSSGAHRTPDDPGLDWLMRGNYFGWSAYGISKLANILFAEELTHRYAGPDLTINSYHPGFVQTQLATRYPLIRLFVRTMYLFVGGSALEGADTGLFLALDQSVQGHSGAYYVDRQVVETSGLARDPNLAGQLWDLSLKLTGVDQYGVVA